MKVRWGRIFLVLMLLVLGCGGAAFLARQARTPSGQEANDPIWSFPGGGDAEPEVQATTIRRATSASSQASGSGQQAGPSGEGLPPFRVISLQYTPYMATLVHMDAGGYLEALGYDLQLVDAYAEDVNLDEAGQCEALKSGAYDALATTLDATRKCGEGVVMAIPVGQSAGNDQIIVKPGVETWNDVFEHAVAFTEGSVSQYMACFASHSANQPIQSGQTYGDAAEAVDAFINTGAEQNIQSVAAWEPEASRALQSVPGSRAILSSKDVRILWDVIEFSRAKMDQDGAPFQAFTEAYYRALLDLTRDPAVALGKIEAWQAEHPEGAGLITTTELESFTADMNNEAFAMLRDAQILMDKQSTVLSRLDEAGFYWRYCGVELPEIGNLASLIEPGFVLQVADRETDLRGTANERPSAEVFQVSDFTDAGAVTDAQIQEAKVLFEKGVEIEFLPNRTDFRAPDAAYQVLENAVRFLRTCQDCLLQVQGGAAYPGSRICPSCTEADSNALAIDRGRRVYDELNDRFDVPEAQLRLSDEPHPPQFPRSDNEEQLRQDRRTFLTGLQLGGR